MVRYAIPAEPVHTFSPHLRSHSVFTPFVHKILDPFTQVFTNLKRGSQCRASCPHQCSRSVVGSVSAARHTADGPPLPTLGVSATGPESRLDLRF